MSNALVIGNGESRKWFTPCHQTIMAENVTTWGCNAIHREGTVDNLVSVDYGMQQEIYDSDYHLNNKCWFSNWSILPSEVADMMFMGYDIPDEFIHKNSKRTGHCVISGKDPTTLSENIQSAINANPTLDIEDLKLKLSKDVGVWITYVEENNSIINVDFPIGWSTGNTALHLACQQNPERVYMMGFDLSAYSEDLNNIYKGTNNYLPSDAKGFNSSNWLNQMKMVLQEFKDIDFYWVDSIDRLGQKEFFQNSNDGPLQKNLNYITKNELCEELKII